MLLRRSGLRELVRNWRHGRHEIDLICLDGETLVFVEVRTRSANGLLSPAESLTRSKLRHFVTAAQLYLAENGLWNKPCRFDVVCVVDTGEGLQTEHHRHVLSLTDVVDCCYATWQPW